jgi:hypothetical protein
VSIQAIQTAARKNSKRRGSSKSEERDKKLTMMVALMVRLLSTVNNSDQSLQIISYLLTWFPYACASIAETTGYSPHSSISYYILGIPTMLTKTSVCLDPIIYFWLNPQFKTEMYAWCRPSHREYDNSFSRDSNIASVRRYCSILSFKHLL